MKYFIQTFGCQMNFADSERVATALEKKGYKPAKNIEEADLVVINSCIVRESAENRVYGLINNLHKSKITNHKSIILTGCLAGWALRNKRTNLNKLRKRIGDEIKIKLIEDIADLDINPQRSSTEWAYVPISNGCNHFCSYCIVPYARGRETYRSIEEITNDVYCALKQGYSQIMLLGQNVNTWCNAEHRGKKESQNNADNFAQLLEVVAKIKGVEKVTFMSANPRDFSDQLITVIAENKNVSREIHLPVQSGDNQVLKAMSRGYTREDYLILVEKLKKNIPEVKITTDLLVGFPNETEKAFQNTVDLCKQVGFKRAFISKYSPRPGTAAAENYEDNISMKVKKQRWQVLEELINHF
jgi:tRNA-2-methylthio-N6-dimethylallyladenosine synthase